MHSLTQVTTREPSSATRRHWGLTRSTPWHGATRAMHWTIWSSSMAIKSYEKAIELDQRFALVWSDKGVALGKLGRYGEAITCFDKALEIEPKLALAWNNKGLALEYLGRLEEAIPCYDKALGLDPKIGRAHV